MGGAHILCPHAGTQTILYIICPLDYLEGRGGKGRREGEEGRGGGKGRREGEEGRGGWKGRREGGGGKGSTKGGGRMVGGGGMIHDKMHIHIQSLYIPLHLHPTTWQMKWIYLLLGLKWEYAGDGSKYLLLDQPAVISDIGDHCGPHEVPLEVEERAG